MKLTKACLQFVVMVLVLSSETFPVSGSRQRINNRGGGSEDCFQVVWNIPSEKCGDLGVDINVRQYGIEVNSRDGWTGDVITIFYGVSRTTVEL